MGSLKNLKKQFPQTDIWMDSMISQNIAFALENDSLGVTTAPTITLLSLREERPYWEKLVQRFTREMPAASERKILWACMYAAAQERAPQLLPLYDAQGNSGRFAIQANMYDYMNADKLLEQAKKVHSLGKNFILKVSTTPAGLKVMEEATALGISVMATNCLSVPQVQAAVHALETGYERSVKAGTAEGLSVTCAMQLGLQDQCIQNYASQNQLDISPAALQWGAIATVKKAYHWLKNSGSRVKMVLSNFTTDDHWKQFMGADIILTFTREYQEKVGHATNLENLIDQPIQQSYIDELLSKIPHFPAEYAESELTPDQYVHFPPMTRTLNLFLTDYDSAVREVRSMIIPDTYAHG